jgi:hypothetical protein
VRDVQDHNKDEDCTVDPTTNTCFGCGAEHGDHCPECGGRAYHASGCSESDEGADEAMDEPAFERALMATLSEAPDDYKSDEALDIEQVTRVETFEAAGMLTRDRGLVVTMKDGSEFQITIVRSK